MIYELFYPLKFHYSSLSWLNVLRYIPFRTIMATITAMLLTFVLAPWFIRELRRKQIGQVVRAEGPATHHLKAGTPTMGGALILLSLLFPPRSGRTSGTRSCWQPRQSPPAMG